MTPFLRTILMAVALTASPAFADGPLINNNGSTSYTYRITLMPDIDQTRFELPNLGKAYCVPTAVLNACAYAGNHGFAGEVMCEDFWMAYYLLSPFYDEVTDLAQILGAIMNTDPEDGTTGANGFVGAQAAMGGGFLVFRYARSSSYWPRYDDLASAALNGALVVPIVGWYPNDFATSRDGGHALTLARLARSGDDRVLGVNDPASTEGNLFAQSMFTREDYAVVPEVRLIDGSIRVVDRVVGLGSSSKDAILDAFYVFIPFHAYHWGGKEGLIGTYSPPTWTVIEPIQMSIGGVILGVVGDSASADLYVLQQLPEALATITTVDVATLAETVLLEQTGLQAIAISRERRLYTLADGGVVGCWQIREDELGLEAETRTRVALDAIAFDNRSDEVVTLSGQTGRLYVWSKDLQKAGETLDLVYDLPGDVTMAVSPIDSTVWYTSDGSEALYGIDRRSGDVAVIEHPLVENVSSLAVTPTGNVLFGDGNETHEITPEGQLVRDSRWAAIGGAPAYVPVSASNFDPATMEGPGWRHEVPDVFGEPIPWCRADLDEDGDVTTADLLRVLAVWATGDRVADITGDGRVGFEDLLALLAAWGPCP